MIETSTIGAIVFACIGFLVFVFRQITSFGLKKKIMKLSVRRKNNFCHDSLNDCLQDQRNQRLLNSLFYRVNLIDLYVKKIIPILMFASVIFFMYTFVLMGEDHTFKVQPSSKISKVLVVDTNGVSKEIVQGDVIFKTSNNKFINFKANNGGVYSLSNTQVLKVGTTLLIVVFASFIVIFLAVAYFKNQTSIEDVQHSISEDIKYLREQLEFVELMLKEKEAKSGEDYKSERLHALEKKMKNLKNSLKEITDIEVEVSKLAS